MGIEWNPSLSVGIPSIDRQHQELFRRVNALLEASSRGKGKQELAPLIDFLGAYVVTHFRSEESEMSAAAYPALDAHKKIHADFIADFGHLKEQFSAEGATTTLVLQLQRRVVDWLLHHIGKEDKAFGAYRAASPQA